MIGKSLSHYLILEKIGQGGMGEVWRARDSTLDREVALKLLPLDLASDPERLARFRREAKVLASLNHPNIAAIYGFEEDKGQSFLVMELAEGEDLSARLARGPIPVDEATEIARQMALGLENAHEKGIVHRDLKPANVKLAPDGTVKILDFGLARAYSGDSGDEDDLANSPTITAAMTQAGTILGTAAYMSPEQAKGKKVDRRADIWAYGVILFEMLGGKPLFAGESVSEILAGVLKENLDFDRLPDDLTPALTLLLQRCLQRDPKLRLRDIGEARILLEDPASSLTLSASFAQEAQEGVSSLSNRARWIPWGLAAVFALALVVSFVMGRGAPSSDGARVGVVRSSIEPPENTGFHLNGANPAPAVVSPDGRSIVFGARDSSGTHMLWLRKLDQATPAQLAGTEDGQYPFWAPDGHAIGFFAKQTLNIYDMESGSTRIIADASNGKGGCWLEDDTILFAPGSSTPISRVDLKGGKPEAVTDLSKGTPANSHRHPRSMHDGRHFLFAARTTDSSSEEPVAIMLGDLEGGEPKTILRSTGQAEYLAGKILYRKNGNIFARAFDPATSQFTGSPILIAKDCGVIPGASLSLFSASASGTLVYHPGYAETSGTRMVWVDLEGKSLGQLDSAGGMGGFDISPDGKRVVFTKWDGRTGFGDLWLHQVDSGVDSRLTFAATSEQAPVWSHDGKTIYYLVTAADSTAIFAIEPDGKEDPHPVYSRDNILQVVDVSPDGKYLSYTVRDSLDGQAILRVEITPVDLSTPPVLLDASSQNTVGGYFSPDGKWIAFIAVSSNSFQPFLKSFPPTNRKWQITTQPSYFLRWSPDGKRIYSQGFDSRLFVTDLDLSGEIPRPEKAVLVNSSFPPPLTMGHEFCVDPSGQRFLVSDAGATDDHRPLHMVMGWTELNR